MKVERDGLASQAFIERAQLTEAKKALAAPLAKVITGPRRAGKSVFAHLLLRDTSYAYVNFDDDDLAGDTKHDALLAAIHQVYGDSKTLLLDEPQNLARWELLVNKLLRRGYNVVITGSNARLLSRELATALTGRHLQFDVFPFSFAEYLRAKGFDVGNTVPTGPADKGILFNHLSEYLKSGGYPEPAVHGIDSRSYLSTLCDAVLLKDIVRRYRLRHPDRIHTLAAWLFANFAGTFTFNSLARALGNLSVPTVETYLGHLEETYLFFMLKRFSTMLKVQLRAPRKIYVVDNGLATAKGFRASPDLGRLFENAVFLYLLRRRSVPNLDLFAYVTRNNHEVDFVVREGTKVVEAIQAAHEIGDEKTADREFRALVEASEELGAETLTLLTWDERRDERYKGKTIRIRPLAEVLLET